MTASYEMSIVSVNSDDSANFVNVKLYTPLGYNKNPLHFFFVLKIVTEQQVGMNVKKWVRANETLSPALLHWSCISFAPTHPTDVL